MPSKVYSAEVVGVEAFEVEIEVHAGWGNTDKIAVVGLPDTAVKEGKDRVTSAICNSGLRWPYGKRITINLAPADVRKEGPSFDLPIALGMLKLEENNRLPGLDAFFRIVRWTLNTVHHCGGYDRDPVFAKNVFGCFHKWSEALSEKITFAEIPSRSNSFERSTDRFSPSNPPRSSRTAPKPLLILQLFTMG
jgi:hypothetical protein